MENETLKKDGKKETLTAKYALLQRPFEGDRQHRIGSRSSVPRPGPLHRSRAAVGR